MIDRFERFVSVISVISHHLHRIMSEEMSKYGLKGPFAVYLIAIYRHPEGITAARLCEICEKNKAAVSRVLAELEEIGMISREDTGYRARIILTERGSQAAEFVYGRAVRAVELAGGFLSEEERETFYRTLESIAGNLKILETKEY